MALGWVALRGSKRLPDAITRFSTLALWAFVIVGVSGVANASVRLVAWGDVFGSSYGRLVVAKVAALGASRRVRLAPASPHRRSRAHGFLTLAVTELFIMAATIGLAVALSRTPHARRATSSRPGRGAPRRTRCPLAPTVGRLAWGWEPTGVALAVVGLGFALYVKGCWCCADAATRGRWAAPSRG